MLRTRMAMLAALFATVRASCPGPGPAEQVDAPPAAGVASTDDDGPASRPFPLTMTAAAEPEQEAAFCDTEHPAPAPDPDTRVYATWQTFPLHRAEHGIDGTLRVLEDSRFTRPGSVRMGTHPMLPPCDPLPARIEVLDASGRVVQAMADFLPQTDVAVYAFAADQTLYQMTEKVHCLASCWCGDGVSFWRVIGGRLSQLESLRDSGKSVRVRGVTRGCYEDGFVRRGADGRYEVQINRMSMGTWVSSSERHWWDGTAWRGAVVERRPRS